MIYFLFRIDRIGESGQMGCAFERLLYCWVFPSITGCLGTAICKICMFFCEHESQCCGQCSPLLLNGCGLDQHSIGLCVDGKEEVSLLAGFVSRAIQPNFVAAYPPFHVVFSFIILRGFPFTWLGCHKLTTLIDV